VSERLQRVGHSNGRSRGNINGCEMVLKGFRGDLIDNGVDEYECARRRSKVNCVARDGHRIGCNVDDFSWISMVWK
jgi:hypothetical protein